MSPGTGRAFHITFVLRGFPLTSETFILRQITGLLDLGHRVRILAEWRPSDEIAHPAVRAYELDRSVTYVHEARGGAWGSSTGALLRVAVSSPGSLGLLGRARAAPYGGRRAVLDRLAALLEAARTDVVHSHFGDVGLQYAEPAERLGIPHVVSFYGYDVTRVPLQRGPDVYAPLFGAVSRVTVLSDDMGQRLRGLGCPERKLRKQHLGVDPSEYDHRERPPPAAGEPLRLLTVARLVEKKGIEYALRAVAELLERRPDRPGVLRYDIIGDGPLRATLEGLASELDLSGHVRFHGGRDQSDVLRAMAGAHVFLLPSVTAADGDEEGTPTVLLEAASTGLPVVSTWHSGIPETVLDGESGFLVPEREVAPLTDRLETLLKDHDLRERMGRRGRRHVEAEFDARVLAKDLERHYEDVIEGSARALEPHSFRR